MNLNSNRLSAGEKVYATLREQILSLELPPGTFLSEKDSALTFGVSRTPVRESFVRLAEEGLVQVLPQRGTFVSRIDRELVEEARFMREQLERAVIRLACKSLPADSLASLEENLLLQKASMEREDDKRMFELDELFHRTLFEGCRKLNTWAAIQRMNVHLNRSRLLRLSSDHDWSLLYAQHRQMYEAIQSRDTDAADRVMREHLSLNITDQAYLQERYPNYYK